MASDSASKAYEYAVKLLTRKDYSEYELRQKLKSRCSQSDADEIILRLQENRYQSDERCAEMLVRHYLGNGYGRMKIYFEACQKKLSRATVDNILDEMNPDWVGVAVELIFRRVSEIDKADYQEKKKIIAFLVRRGYSVDEAVKALKKAVLLAGQEKGEN